MEVVHGISNSTLKQLEITRPYLNNITKVNFLAMFFLHVVIVEFLLIFQSALVQENVKTKSHELLISGRGVETNLQSNQILLSAFIFDTLNIHVVKFQKCIQVS